TIGGHVCQGGVGMGAFQYGPVASQVLSTRIVLPNGDVKVFSGRELEVVTECEGITGIVTKLTLRVAKYVEKVPLVATFDTSEALAKTLEDVTKRFQPWNITFHNPTFSALREEAGGPKTIPRKKYSALFVFAKTDYEKVKAPLADSITKSGGKLLADAVANAEWGEIFNTLRAKALGPSIAPGEVVFPLSKLSKFLETAQKKFDYNPLSIEGTLIQGGFVTILAFALEDERRGAGLAYALGFSAGIQLLKLGKELGGRAYAPGLYLATESKHVFGNRRYQRIVDFKRAVDKANIMNPGKILGVRPRLKAIMIGIPPLPAPPGAPMSTVAQVLNAPPMVWAMGKLAPMISYHRTDEAAASEIAANRALGNVQGSWFGQRNGWHAYSCSQCGFCRRDAPMTTAVGFEAGTPSGLLTWAKLYVEGKLPVTKKVEDMVAGWSESTIKDEVCPSRIPISQLAKDLRVQLEYDAGRKFVLPAALRERIKKAEVELAERDKKNQAPPPAPVAAPAPPAPVAPRPAARPAPPPTGSPAV
ncbi:MAG TPA: FAD-binding and (Fe-S)-binding domain-containing protein, partial [Candidatus Thermoplasmatota archaeon]|nr:FAD-binding and (Fe-S)-binding domain-containing protein [Candidatus Thermoplasmatota archaeon]